MKFRLTSRAPFTAALCAAAVSCAHELPAPDEPGAAEAYRAALERDPGGEHSREARESLEQAQFTAARRAHTVLAYRQFLSEFPTGADAPAAHKLLEGLRWEDAHAHGTEAALLGFVQDEPAGAHAQEAWAEIARLRLKRAVASGSAAELRAWLDANPAAAGRAEALAALDRAAFEEASHAQPPQQGELFRGYLREHPDGLQREAAQRQLDRSDVDAAALLEDLGQLASLAHGPGAAGQQARVELERVTFARAAAQLDVAALRAIAREHGSAALASAHLLAQLGAAAGAGKQLIADARALFLPRPASTLLPEEVAARARALQALAASLEGAALPRVVAELAHPNALVALSAEEAARALLAQAPQAEMQLRSRRLLATLRPLAQDGPRLAAVALLLSAGGDSAGALAEARKAIAREPHSLVALRVAAGLEAEAGQPQLAAGTAAALAAEAAAQGAARGAAEAGAAAGASARLWSLCAESWAADAARELAQRSGSAAAAASEEEASARLKRILHEAESTAHLPGACDELRGGSARLRDAREAERLAAAQRFAAVRAGPGAAALARALARDPSAGVRAAAGGNAAGGAAGGDGAARLR